MSTCHNYMTFISLIEVIKLNSDIQVDYIRIQNLYLCIHGEKFTQYKRQYLQQWEGWGILGCK